MKKLIKFLIVLVIILFCVYLGLNYYKKNVNKSNNKKEQTEEKVKQKEENKDNNKEPADNNAENNSSNKETEEKTNSTSSSNNTKSYTFANEFGDGEKETKVDAKEVVSLSGFAGASSNVYYIDGNDTLHYLELVNLTDTKIATNIKELKVTDDSLIAYKSSNTKILKENEYVEYK